MFKIFLENRWWILFIWYKVDKREELSDVIWLLKFKFEFNIILRFLVEVMGFNFWLRKGIVIFGSWDRSCFVLNSSNLVLLGLISKWFV